MRRCVKGYVPTAASPSVAVQGIAAAGIGNPVCDNAPSGNEIIFSGRIPSVFDGPICENGSSGLPKPLTN